MSTVISTIIINKNRGWRGLAELRIIDESHTIRKTMIFSFSQEVWNDMLDGHIVVQDEKYYYILTFDNLMALPRRDQQRSVLIKNFTANVLHVNRYEKTKWSDAVAPHWSCISHFLKNRNNHTQSDWNCIGLRVMPII